MTNSAGDLAPSTAAALALLRQFVARGVRDVIVCPGSRSQALALAAAALESRGDVRLRVRIDERVAGFVALGLAVETGVPTVVITTSGSAVANLHPAVLEAHHAGVPLIIVTADRPSELRGIASNQTTTQPGVFASAVSQTWDVPAPSGEPGEGQAMAALANDVVDAAGAAGGPVHVNLAFREPLSSPLVEIDGIVAHDVAEIPDPIIAAATDPLELRPAAGTVVIAGAGAGPEAEELAHQLGAPLIAEVVSGAHFGPHLVVAYRELLSDPDFGGTVRRAIVLGHPTLSREVSALVTRDDVETIVVRGPGAEAVNPGRRATVVSGITVARDPGARSEARAETGAWVATSRALVGDTAEPAPLPEASRRVRAETELAAVRAPVTRRTLVEAVWKATWPHDRLVVGASRLVRELDRVAVGKRVPVHANRGLAGIDGTIGTGVGIALASQEAGATGTTRVLLGDLALLHDAGSLAFGAGEHEPRIQVIVGDDGGGTIFDRLEVASQSGPLFDRVMLTPQRVDIAALAAAYGWEYVLVENRGDLDPALTASTRPRLIHVPLPR